MNYTFHQLQIFLKVSETLSVTKAAEELHLTQPAVSIQLKNFQDQFEIPLTEVIGRKIYLTEFGKEIAQSAEGIVEQLREINQRTARYKGLLTGSLRISVVSTGKYVMPYFLASFMKSNPDVELRMDVTNKADVLESLEHNEVDFALVSIIPKRLNVEKIDLLQNKLYLIGRDQRLVRSNSKKIFRELPLIFREEGSGTRQAMESFIERNKLSIVKKMELTSNEAVKQAVLAGLGYSIMPLIGIRNELLRGELQIVPVPGLPIKTQWQLIWLKGRKHRPIAAAFLHHLKDHKDKVIREVFIWYESY